MEPFSNSYIMVKLGNKDIIKSITIGDGATLRTALIECGFSYTGGVIYLDGHAIDANELDMTLLSLWLKYGRGYYLPLLLDENESISIKLLNVVYLEGGC